jgi:Na+/proline symporter
MGGFIAGAVDFNNNEPQAAVLVIVFFAGVLGFTQPRKAWRWALIVGLGVPIVYLIATAFGYSAKNVPEPGWYASLIALIPAFVSTYVGALLRKALLAG